MIKIEPILGRKGNQIIKLLVTDATYLLVNLHPPPFNLIDNFRTGPCFRFGRIFGKSISAMLFPPHLCRLVMIVENA